jgi:hypothetical protein
MAGPPYSAFIEAELVDERAAQSELRQRSLTVVSTSGGLVTLLAGLIAIAAGGDTDFLPKSGRGPLAVAMVSYVVAAVVALCANVPRKLKAAKVGDLAARVEEDKFWITEADDSSLRAIADLRVRALTVLRRSNGQLAWVVTAAILAEVVAIGATGLTAFEIFTER